MTSKSDKSDTKKKKLLEALELSLGVVTSACKKAGVHRSTYYEWYKEDEDFRKQVDDLNNVALDFAESQLHQQIQGGNTSATIFYLKTKGKQRGYVERQEHTGVEGTKLFDIEVVRRSEPEDQD